MYISGSLSMRNSTVTDNLANYAGGLNVVGDVDLDFCTIVDNTSVYGNGGVTAGGNVTITNSILYNNLSNTDSDEPVVVDIDADGETSISDSLLTPNDDILPPMPAAQEFTFIIYGDPQLGSLRNNGGFTLPGGSTITTMMPRSGSPVIDTRAQFGIGTSREETDQRGAGYPRLIGEFPDLGAVEYRRQSRSPSIDWDRYQEQTALPDTK
jgi:hypothetical protein